MPQEFDFTNTQVGSRIILHKDGFDLFDFIEILANGKAFARGKEINSTSGYALNPHLEDLIADGTYIELPGYTEEPKRIHYHLDTIDLYFYTDTPLAGLKARIDKLLDMHPSSMLKIKGTKIGIEDVPKESPQEQATRLLRSSTFLDARIADAETTLTKLKAERGIA